VPILKDIIHGIPSQDCIYDFYSAQAMIRKFAHTLLVSIDTKYRESILLTFNQFYRHSKAPLAKA
jgi:hypothetical protein